MLQKLKQMIVPAAVVVFASGIMASPLVPSVTTVDAINPAEQAQTGVKKAGGGGRSNNNLSGLIKKVVNILLFLIGAVAVIMIIIGGIRYTISNGEGAQVTGAKNTILYAVIGLVVALLAYAIVNFVLDQFA